VVTRLNAELVAALNDPAIRAAMLGLGVEPAPGSADEFGQTIKTEIQKWAGVIKLSGTRLD
jgi:tripartite-type tricarboxylate transporter receptor subunit TctC